MGIIIRQSIKSSLFNYLGIALGYINMVWFFPSILSEERFGLLRVVISVSMLLAQFGEFGLSNTLNRFFPYFKRSRSQNGAFIAYICLLASAFTIVLLLALFSFKEFFFSHAYDHEVHFSEHFPAILVITISVVFSEILYALSRASYKAVFPSFIKETLLRFLQTFSILLFYFDMVDFEVFVLLFASTYFISLLTMFTYLYFKGLIRFRHPALITRVKSPSEILTYSFYVFLNKLPNRAINQIDVLMLGALAGLKSAGAYSIAFFIAEVVRIPARNISLISNPLIAEAWKNNELGEINKIYRQSSINQLLIGGFFLILVLSNVNDFTFYLQNKYSGIFPVLALLGLAKVFDMTTGINGLIIANSTYYRYSLIFSIALLILAVISNYLLIPPYGIRGAALATALSVFLLNGVKTLFVLYKFNMQPFTIKTLVALVLLALTYLLTSLVTIDFGHIINIVVRILLSSIFFLPAIYFLKVSPEINGVIKALLNRIRS